MSVEDIPLSLIDSYNKKISTGPLYWQIKTNKGGESYLRYIAYSKSASAIDAAKWFIIENRYDTAGNLVQKKIAVTGSSTQGTFDQVFDGSGSGLTISAITKASPGQVTTTTDHGLSNGDKIEVVGVVGMTEVNSDVDIDARGAGAIVFTITVVDATNLTIGVDTSAYTTYVSDGTAYNKNIFGLTYS